MAISATAMTASLTECSSPVASVSSHRADDFGPEHDAEHERRQRFGHGQVSDLSRSQHDGDAERADGEQGGVEGHEIGRVGLCMVTPVPRAEGRRDLLAVQPPMVSPSGMCPPSGPSSTSPITSTPSPKVQSPRTTSDFAPTMLGGPAGNRSSKSATVL